MLRSEAPGSKSGKVLAVCSAALLRRERRGVAVQSHCFLFGFEPVVSSGQDCVFNPICPLEDSPRTARWHNVSPV